MLAIARQIAPRLASIEGCKLPSQKPPCLRLVIVRVRDEMDLDAFLVAAHCGTRARAKDESEVRDSISLSMNAAVLMGFKYSRHGALRANVKSSMTHHSLEQYVDPATTSSVWQPARKTGKQASDCWMLFWSMHALSCSTARRAYIYLAHVCMRWDCGE